MTKILQIS